MITLDASMFPIGKQSQGVNGILASIPPYSDVHFTDQYRKGWVLKDGGIQAIQPVSFELHCDLDFSGGTDNGFNFIAQQIRYRSNNWYLRNVGKSGIYIAPTSGHISLDLPNVFNYNTCNVSVAAGVFADCMGGKFIPDVNIYGGNISTGHGNLWRIGGVEGGTLVLGKGDTTLSGPSLSAEGVTINGNNITIRYLNVNKAAASTVLIWPDRNLHNISIVESILTNGAQAGMGNPAIEINPQGYTIDRVSIINTLAQDTQTPPTMGDVFVCNGTGVLTNFQMLGWVQKGGKWAQDPSTCLNKVTAPGAVFNSTWQ